MNEFEITTVINRPPVEVFAALLNFERAADWNPGTSRAQQLTDGPFQEGSKVRYEGKFLGRSYESTSECIRFEAGRSFVTKTISGPFLLEVESILEESGPGTRLLSRYRGESQGFFKLAEPVVVRLTKRQFETANENFKEMLEAGLL